MNEKHFIVATAGHVDHGKSALVKALTGTDPDRLPEEKARGITIDLGFANLCLADNATVYNIGIVDVPGHEDFVKNMVAGVGAIDVAVFVVAADDGWMPQTEEHLHILTYLGIERAVVALTKSDLASNIVNAEQQIRDRLCGTPFANAPIVATSVINGTGIDALKQALVQALSSAKPARDIGKPRLPVDRVFTLRGVGTVVTGTLMGGKISRGQSVIIQPGGATARVRSVQSHNAEIESAQPGSRTALNLPDLHANETVRRGDVVTIAELGKPTSVLNVTIQKLGRSNTEKTSVLARPLKNGARVRVHHGTGDFTATVMLLDAKQLGPGENSFAQLRLESPAFAFNGDHFIIRDWAQQTTLAGGVILDAHGDVRNFRSENNRRFMQAVGANLALEEIVTAIAARDHFLLANELQVQSQFSATEIDVAVSQLASAKKIMRLGDWLAAVDNWSNVRNAAMNLIDAAHKKQPDAPGYPLTELRSQLDTMFEIPPDIFQQLMADLTHNGFVQTGDRIKRATHQLSLPPHLQPAGVRLRAALAAKPLDPPSRKELAPDALTQQALRFLINAGEAVELDPQITLSSRAFTHAVD
ncbi:MAG: selenocysteine-specific translation elongation factor, partial [Limisphaerales bacterium]